MPTIDKRFLLKLLIAVICGLGTLFALHAWQAQRIPEALRRQADRAVEASKPETAIRHLKQYLEFRPDDIDAQEQLAGLLRATHALGEVHFLYDRILRADPEREKTRADALSLALSTGRYSDAMTHAETLLKSSPENALLWQQLGAAQAGLRLFDAAKTSYETAIRHNPRDPRAWQRLAQFLMVDRKQIAEARTLIDRMVAALPDEPGSYLTRMRFAALHPPDVLPARKADPFLADADKALALTPDSPEVLLLKAERLQRHRDITGARAALAQGVAKHPGHADLVRALAWLEVNRNNVAGAVGVLEDALPHVSDPLDLLVPLADLLLDAGEVAKAEEIVRKLDRRSGPTVKLQSKYLRSRLAMQAGQWHEAVTLLTSLRSEAVTLPGLESQANLLLARCFEMLGEPTKAIDALKLICAKDATHVTAHIALGQLYMNDGRFADAIRVYETAVQSPYAPASAITMLVRLQALQLAQAHAKPEAWLALEKQLQAIAPRYGQTPDVAILQAELKTLAGYLPDAARILKAELTRRPQSTLLWCKLAEAVANIEGIAAGLMVLDEAQSFVPDGSELRLTRAKLYANDPAKLRPLDALLNGIDAWPDTEQLQFARGMIEVYDSIGVQKRELWQRILALRPDDGDTWQAYLRIFDDELAREEAKLNRSRLVSQGSNPFEIMVAKLTTADGPRLEKLLRQLDADPRWHGEPFRRVIRKSKSMTVLAAAQPWIERLPGGLGWLADQYGTGPGNGNQLANEQKHLELCQSAVKSPMANADDWFRLVMATPRARRADIVAEAGKHLPKMQAAALEAMLALCTEGGNNVQPVDDRTLVAARLAIFQARLDRGNAIRLLEQYLKIHPLPVADRAWATRQLAMLLVVRGEVADRERAARMLSDAALTNAGSTLEDRRATAATLASLHRYLDGPSRDAASRKAIELLETVSRDSKLPRDAFSLCRLYKAAGRTDDAIAKLRELLQSDPGNIDYLLAGLDVLVEAGQYTSAEGFAARLMTLAGEEYRVIAAVAKLEALRGNTSRALELAEGYFRSSDPLAGDVPAKTTRTAELLDDLARLTHRSEFADAAILKYESLLPGRAEALLRLTSLLASLNRGDEAFGKFDKLSRGVSKRVVATAAVTTLRLAGGSPEHKALVKKWIDAAKAEEPRSIRLVEAEYLMLTGEYTAAEAIYEAVLKEQPRNVAALNNLAWLLAAKPECADRALQLIDEAAKETGLTGELLDTRARVRLAAKQPALAALDAEEALKHSKTALRYFHLALAKNELQSPEGEKLFREAKQRGLTDRQIHPADVPVYQALSKR